MQPRLEALERRDLLTSYAYTTAEDTQLAVTDSTITGATIVTAPTHGKVSFAASGGFVYTPAENYNGSDGFTFSINPNTTSPPTTLNDVSITITPVNDPPKVFPDQFAAQENTTLTIDAPGVLKNDTDVDGDKLTAILATKPLHGTVQLGDGGGFAYTPTTDYFGPDSFTYKASDKQATSDATTAYLYVAQNKPVAKDDYYGVASNGTLNIPAPGVLANDLGVNGRGMTASLEDGKGPQHGSVTVNGDGSFTYTPATGYIGDDSFVYRATDNSPAANPLPAAYSDATVHLSVRSTAPIVYAANDNYTAIQNATLSVPVPGVLGNDKVYSADATSNTGSATPLTLPLNSVVVNSTTHGTLTLNLDGSFSYAPNKDFYGSDTFTYRAVLAPPAGTTTSPPSNPISHDVATVTIKVIAPIVATTDSYTTQQNVTLNIAKPGVLGNDYFAIPVPPFNQQPNTPPTNQPPFTAALISSPPATAGSVQLKADGSFTFVPATNFFGLTWFTYQDTFTLTAEDGTTQTLVSNVATVGINVAVVNTPPTPTAKDDHFVVLENGTLNIAAPGVLGNDVKADDYPLVANVQQKPAHGLLTLNGDGSFTYQPAAGYTGDDSFTYYDTETYVPPQTPGGPVSDPIIIKSAPATVTISVRAPIVYANNDSFYVIPGATLSIDQPGVLKNDYVFDPTNTAATTSPLNLPLIATVVNTTPNGQLTLNADGSFTYTPNSGFAGTDSFNYRASLAPPNSSPPGAGTTGTDANGNLTTHDVATVTIVVRAPVPSPVAVDDSFSTPAGTKLQVAAPGVIANDKKADGSSLQALVGTKTSHGDLQFNADGSFTYTPASGFTGDDSFTYQDFELLENPTPPSGDPNQYISNFATVTIHVKPTTSAPVANNDYFKVLQGGAIVLDPPGVLANDKGPDGHQLAAVLDNTTSNGQLKLTAAGGFTYTPDPTFSGFDKFTYHVIDTSSIDSPQPASNIATVTIYVQPLHPLVYANPDFYQTLATSPLSVGAPGVLKNDTLYPPTAVGSNGTVNPPNTQQPIPPIGDYTLTAALKQRRSFVRHARLPFRRQLHIHRGRWLQRPGDLQLSSDGDRQRGNRQWNGVGQQCCIERRHEHCDGHDLREATRAAIGARGQ